MAYIVNVYDPRGTVPPSYRSARNTWVMSPCAEPLRLFATERAACAFIAMQGPFTGLEMCVERFPRLGGAFLERGSVATTADAAL